MAKAYEGLSGVMEMFYVIWSHDYTYVQTVP